MTTTRSYSSFVPVAVVACASTTHWSPPVQAQRATGVMTIYVTVQEPVRSIALLHALEQPRLVPGAGGAYATTSLSVSLETPFSVRVRSLGGDSSTRGNAPIVRLRGGTPRALGPGDVTLAGALPAGEHDLTIEFAPSSDEAQQLVLPATEVTITTTDGDAMTEATATFAAATLPLPVASRRAAPTEWVVAARGRSKR